MNCRRLSTRKKFCKYTFALSISTGLCEFKALGSLLAHRLPSIHCMHLRFSASIHPLLYFAILLCLQSCLLDKVDRRPYQQMSYYAQMRQRLDTLTIQSPGSGPTDTIRAGW